jgi:hypothetical protein
VLEHDAVVAPRQARGTCCTDSPFWKGSLVGLVGGAGLW